MNRTHGKEGTKIYDVWVNMKQRCLNAHHHTFPYYGGRGITVCERWLHFSNFYADMGDPPNGGYTLDRVDPDGNYELNNCRWLPRALQVRNIRKSIYVEIDGQTRHLAEWCELRGLSYKVVFQRVKRDGLSPMVALTRPILRSRKKRLE